MHIVLLTDRENSGGATIAARRMARALFDAGAQVTQVIHHVDNAQSTWSVELLPDPTFCLPRKIERRLLPRRWSQPREDARASRALAAQLERLQPDVVNVHNLHSAARFGWRWNLLETALGFAPVAWTLHDQWSFTGRCAYSYDCPLFQSGCDARCPTPHEYPELVPDLIAPAWQSRRAFFARNASVAAITPSRWLAEMAVQGLWSQHRLETIAYCLPLEVFQPQHQAMARQTLGLDEVKGPLLLASATSWHDRRKGGTLLSEALQEPILRPWKEKTTVATLGEGQLQVSGVRVASLGIVDDENTLATAYAAADFLVHPAIMDNLPNVVIESLACGTPVVALPVGGLSEMVRENQTGFLADHANAGALARALLRALETSNEQKNQLRINCRQFAESHFSPATQASRTLAFFEELIAKRKEKTP